ncbi:MAG: hypothetical protein Q7262_04040 [Bacteroidales bacterium]|nr:hypothetical protein [Bacteroidales bacterium]
MRHKRVERELENVREIVKIWFTALLTAVLCSVLLLSSTVIGTDNLSVSAQPEHKSSSEQQTEPEEAFDYAFSFSMPQASPFMAIVHDGTVSLPGVTARSSSPWSSSGVNIRLGKTLQYSEIRENSLKRVFAHSVLNLSERQILTFSYSNNKFVYLLREIII